jgi:hypothetical protein
MYKSSSPILGWSGTRNGLLVGLAAVILALLLTACVSAPPAPNEALASAQNAIDIAEQSDARQYAATELDEAREQLALAHREVSRGDMESALRWAHQSTLMAELAVAKTESTKATNINRETERGLQALRDEMDRAGGQL